MQIKTDFENNGNIPSKYTCDGDDLAPVLEISDIPENAKELVMIMDDPDAPMGTWVHWILYNIPPNTKIIDNYNLSKEIKSGFTSFQRLGWGGPCPPNGVHRYFFKLYALDKKIEMPEGLTKSQVLDKIQGSVIDYTELVGLYKRI